MPLDLGTPHEDCTADLQEHAKELYRMYVEESWWTRCSMLFLYLGILASAVGLAVLWLSIVQSKKGEPAGIWTVFIVCVILLVAHIKSENRIHERFRSENPEEYELWKTGKVTEVEHDNWSSNVGNILRTYD